MIWQPSRIRISCRFCCLCTLGNLQPSGRKSVTPKMNALLGVSIDGGFVHIVVSPPCTFSQLHLGCQAILVGRVSLSAGSLSVGIVTSVSQSGGMATLRPCHQYSQQLSSIFPAIVINIPSNCVLNIKNIENNLAVKNLN